MTEVLTPRLHLRQFRADDFEAHARICADPEVMQYIRAGATSREESWWQLARYMGHWQLRGYGLWAVVEKSTSRLVGHLGFLNPEGGHGIEIGWVLAREAWGQGYALEGTQAALRYGFESLGFSRVLCLIQPENLRSIRLAERLGAHPSGETHDPGGRRLLIWSETGRSRQPTLSLRILTGWSERCHRRIASHCLGARTNFRADGFA